MDPDDPAALELHAVERGDVGVQRAPAHVDGGVDRLRSRGSHRSEQHKRFVPVACPELTERLRLGGRLEVRRWKRRDAVGVLLQQLQLRVRRIVLLCLGDLLVELRATIIVHVHV